MESLPQPGEQLATLAPIVDPNQPPEALIAAERAATITHMITAIDTYSQSVEVSEDSDAKGATTQKARDFLWGNGIHNVMALASDNPDDLALVLAAADRLEQKLDGGSVMGDVMGLAFSSRASQSFQELVRRKNVPIGRILSRIVKSPEDMAYHYGERLMVIEKIVEPVYGSRFHWGAKDRSKLPSFLHDLMDSASFAFECEQWMVGRLNNLQETLPENQYFRARQFERLYLTNVLGFSPELANEVRRAIQGRTMKSDENGMVIGLSDGGGVDMEDWQSAMMGLRQKVEELGIDTIHQLREQFGIVNFDRYALPQLQRMKMIMQSDPEIFQTLSGAEQAQIAELMEQLRSGNLALVVTAAYGDYNGAFNSLDRFDNNGLSIFAEIGDLSPGGFYAAIRRIVDKFDLQPTTLVAGAHGIPGGMDFETSSGERTLGVPGTQDENNPSWVHVAKTRIGRIVSRFMKPHSKTGKKYIVLLSCSQASPTDKGQTNPETIVELSNPADRLVVSAMRDPAWFRRDNQGVYAEVEAGHTWHRHRAEVYEWGLEGKIRHSQDWYFQGIK